MDGKYNIQNELDRYNSVNKLTLLEYRYYPELYVLPGV